jgi:hypothetical protein
MKHKKLPFLLALVLLCTQALLAQKFNVSFSEEKTRKRVEYDGAVSLPDGNTLMLQGEFKGGSIFSSAKYEGKLVLANKDGDMIKEQEVKVDEERFYGLTLTNFKKTIVLVYNYYDKESKTTGLKSVIVDPKTLSISKSTTLGVFESDSKSDQADIDLIASPDSSKFMVYVDAPDNKKENRKYYLSVYDSDIKVLWKKMVELPYTQRYAYVIDKTLGNDGKAYISAKIYDKEVKRESVRENGSKVPSYIYKLTAHTGTSAKDIDLKIGEKFVHRAIIEYNAKENIYSFAGLYKEKVKGRISGVIYANFNGATDAVITSKTVPFDEEILTMIDKDNFGSDSKSDPGLYDEYKIIGVRVRNNGSIDIVSEYQEVVQVTSTNANGTGSRVSYRYYYGSIVNTNISKTGSVIFTRVPKNQKHASSYLNWRDVGRLSAYPLVYNDKLVLLFNDDKDNVDRDLSKKPDDIMNFKSSVLVAATINAKGELTREAIHNNDDDDYVVSPRYALKSDENTYILTADLFKFLKFRTKVGKLTIK